MTDDITVRVGLDASGYLIGVQGVQRRTDDLQRSLSRLGTGLSRSFGAGMNALTRLDLVQITVQESAERVAAAQRSHTAALADFGPVSTQAVAAGKELAAAQDQQEKAALRARMSYVLIAGDMVALGAKAPQLVASFYATAASARAAAAGMTTLQLATLGVIGAAAGIAAVFGGIAAFKEWEQRTRRGATATKEFEMAQKRLETTQERLNLAFVAGNTIGVNFLALQDRVAVRLPGITSLVRDQAKAQERLNEAQDAVDLEDAITETQAKAKADAEAAVAVQAHEQAQQRLVSAVTNGYSSLGINLSAFSQGFQEQMLRNAGVSEDFIASLRPAVDIEQMLASASGETGEALRAQAHITKKKDETTAEFTERLRVLGFTEAEVRDRINETGDALLSQAEATRTAAMATTSFTGGGSGGSLTASSSGFVRGPPVSSAPSLAEFIASNADAVQRAFLGGRPGASTGMAFDPRGVASYLMSGQSGIGVTGVGAYVGSGAGSSQYVRMVNVLKNMVVSKLPSNQWDSLLAQLGVNGFAHGVEGIVRKPGLFRLAEHGAESIQVRPLARPSVNENASGKTVVFAPGSIVVNGRNADDLLRNLQRLGVVT